MTNGAKIQVEEGEYTRIHNAILETLATARLSPLEFRIVLFVLRKTYGWNKKMDVISITQFEQCGGNRANTIRAIQNLLRLKVLNRILHGLSYEYGLNKYIETWLPEVFITRNQNRENNFHGASIHDGTGIADGTTSSIADDTKSSIPDGTHKRHKDNIKDKKSSGKKLPAHDPLLDNPAIVEYKRIAKYQVPTAWRETIASQVKDTKLWGTIVYDWIGYGWNKQNIKGMLEAYRAGGIQRKNGNKPTQTRTLVNAATGETREEEI